MNGADCLLHIHCSKLTTSSFLFIIETIHTQSILLTISSIYSYVYPAHRKKLAKKNIILETEQTLNTDSA